MSAEKRLALGLPALLALLLFLRVLGAGYVYDDRPLLSENPRMQQWSAVGEAFTTPYWGLVDSERDAAGFYRPLGATTLTLGWKLAGGHAWGLHLLSLLLHAGCAAAVGALGLALGWRPGVAAAAGALFALHGAHVEAVAWISAIPDLLATLFSLLALRAMVRERTPAAAGWLLAALLCKEAALGAWLLAAGMALLLRRWRALPVLAAPLLVVYLLRAQAFGDAGGWDWSAGLTRVTTHHGLAPADQWGLSLSLLGRYLGYLLWPWPHRPFDPLRLDLGWADAARLVPALLGTVAALAAGLLWLRRGRSSTLVLVPLGLTFAALAPVMNTRALGQFPFEERFLYLPSAGFCLLVAGLLLGTPGGAVAVGARTLWAKLRAVGPLVLGVLLLGNAAAAWAVTGKWQDEETFFDWARTVSPDSMTPHVEYGRLMLEKAQRATDVDDRAYFADEAFDAFKRSLQVDVDEVLVTAIEREKGNVGQGDALFLAGDLRAAEAVYEQIVGHYRDSKVGYLGLGNARAQLALRMMALRDQEPEPGNRERMEVEIDRLLLDALDAFDRALALAPELIAATAGKGVVLFQLQRFDEAAPLLERAFRWQPWNFDYALPLAQCYGFLDRLTQARRTLEAFLLAAPDAPPQLRLQVEQFIADLRLRSG